MLFLDFDGTLVDDTARHYAAYVDVIESTEIKGKAIPQKEYWGLRQEDKPWQEICKRSRLFPPRYKLYQERFEERLETPEFLTLDTIRPGVETALGKLYTKTPIVLVTLRRDPTNLESQVASLGLSKYFVTILSGAPKKGRRPDPDARWKHKAQLVRNRYRIPPVESLWIGDTETDVKAARALGFEVWLLEGGHRTKDKQIAADPDRIEADLSGALKYLLPGGRWQR